MALIIIISIYTVLEKKRERDVHSFQPNDTHTKEKPFAVKDNSVHLKGRRLMELP